MLMKNQGFTLVELMIAIAILGILSVWAVPSFQTLIQNNRITTQANSFLAALSTTRSEAVKRGTTTSMCPSNDQATCTNSPWDGGWIIFTDDPAAGFVGTLDGADVLLKISQGFDGGATLTELGGAVSVSFTSTGLATAATSFQLRIPNCQDNQARDINVALTGRAAVTKIMCP